jgi:hypothetical protein
MPRVPPEGTTQAQSVCGNKLKGMTTYECHDQKYKKQLASVGVDCRKDDETIHPRSFCNRCYTAARQHTSLGSTLVVPFLWKEHMENECQVYVNNHVSQKFRNNTQVCHHFPKTRTKEIDEERETSSQWKESGDKPHPHTCDTNPPATITRLESLPKRASNASYVASAAAGGVRGSALCYLHHHLGPELFQ